MYIFYKIIIQYFILIKSLRVTLIINVQSILFDTNVDCIAIHSIDILKL